MFSDIKAQMEDAANYARAVEAQRVQRLRDEFAMAALAGLLANPEPTPTFNTVEDFQSHYARIAFGYADAMMEARK